MKKFMFIILVLCMSCMVSAKSFRDNLDGLSFRVLSDGEVVQGEFGWTGKIDDDAEAVRAINGKTVEYGMLARWDEDDPKNLNGLGGYALLMVDPNITLPLKELLPFVGGWLNLPETLTGEASVGVAISVVNFQEEPDAVLSPMVNIAVGPICVRASYDWVEGDGNEKGATSSEGRVMLGGCFSF